MADILNKIGDVVYSDPELPNVNYLNESSLRNVIVDISAPVVINNTIITVTDNKTQTYSKLWDGEPIVFTLPKKHDFIVYADDYITEEGKTYSLKESIFVGDNNNLTLIFETKTGVEIKENTVIYYDDYVDWYIYLDKFNGIWGSSNIFEVNIDNPFVSENNGLDNTKIIANTNKNSIFANALSFEFFDPKVIGFIPTCLELEIFSTHLHEINEKLVKENKNIIDLSDLWTSESFNEFEAWNGNGEKISKDISLNYYIFGKKMR